MPRNLGTYPKAYLWTRRKWRPPRNPYRLISTFDGKRGGVVGRPATPGESEIAYTHPFPPFHLSRARVFLLGLSVQPPLLHLAFRDRPYSLWIADPVGYGIARLPGYPGYPVSSNLAERRRGGEGTGDVGRGSRPAFPRLAPSRGRPSHVRDEIGTMYGDSIVHVRHTSYTL